MNELFSIFTKLITTVLLTSVLPSEEAINFYFNESHTATTNEITISTDSQVYSDSHADEYIGSIPLESIKTPTNITELDYDLSHSEPTGDIFTYIATNITNATRLDAPQNPFSISWKGGHIYYRLTNGNTGEYIELVPDDEGSQSNTLLIGSLLTNSEHYKYLDIYSRTEIEKLQIDEVKPTTDIEYQSRLTALMQTAETSIQTTGSYNLNSGASYTENNIVTRDEWGVNPSSWSGSSKDIDDPTRLSWEPYYYGVNRAIIHHTTGNYSGYTGTQAMRSIYLYHAITRGWGDIGYNYLIFSDGTIYEGKLGGEGVYGYHAYTPANRLGIAISMIGDFSYSLPTSAARESLRKILAEKAVFYDWDSLKYSSGAEYKWASTSYNVFGHGDSYFYCYQAWDLDFRSTYGYSYLYCNEPSEYDSWAPIATACPGYTLSDRLPTLVSIAEEYRDNPGTYYKLKKVVEEVEQQFDEGQILENKIYVTFNLPETATVGQVEALIPSFSGITSYTIDKNTAILTVEDWDNGGYIPPEGWTGWSYDEGSFFPASKGAETQMKTLLKIFRMSDDVKSADIKTVYETH